MFYTKAFKKASSLKCCRFSQVAASGTGLNQGSDATSHLHTALVDMFVSIYMKYHEGIL